MKRSVIVAAFAVLVMFMTLAVYQTGSATAKLAESGWRATPYGFMAIDVEKSDRHAADLSVAAGDDDMMIEGIIDCYDQFGPEGAEPNAVSLNSCMPT